MKIIKKKLNQLNQLNKYKKIYTVIYNKMNNTRNKYFKVS